MGTQIIYVLLFIPAVLCIWPISYKIQTVEREYSLDFALSEDGADVEMIPPSSYYNQIKSKMTFLRPRNKPKRQSSRKKRKHTIVEMLKRLWSSKILRKHNVNKTQPRNPHKSILTIRNLHDPGRRHEDVDIKELEALLAMDKGRLKTKPSERITKKTVKSIRSKVTNDNDNTEITSTEPEESYEDLEREYMDMLNKEREQKQVFNYTSNRNQTVKEKLLSSIKKPKNCTQESWTAIGLGTLDCLRDDLKHARGMKDYFRVVRQFGRMLIVWISVVAATVTTLWCWKGWCCCCCVGIRWCYPDDLVYDIKRYMVLNPPGILTQPDGTVLKYSPTEREYFAYQKLKYSILQY